MIVGRGEQCAGDGAAVDHLEVTLGRIDLDVGHVEERAKVLFHDVIDRGVLGFEGNSVRHRDEERRGLCCGLGRCCFTGTSGRVEALHHGYKTVVLIDDGFRNVEQFEGAARLADSLRERAEALVLWIKGDAEIRADVGTDRFAREAAEIRTTAAGAAGTTGSFTTRTAGIAATFKARTIAMGGATGGSGRPIAARGIGLWLCAATFGRLAGAIAGAAGGALEITPIATWGGVTFTSGAIVAPFTFGARRATGSLFFLGPGGPETKALKLR